MAGRQAGQLLAPSLSSFPSVLSPWPSGSPQLSDAQAGLRPSLIKLLVTGIITVTCLSQATCRNLEGRVWRPQGQAGEPAGRRVCARSPADSAREHTHTPFPEGNWGFLLSEERAPSIDKVHSGDLGKLTRSLPIIPRWLCSRGSPHSFLPQPLFPSEGALRARG